MGFLLNVMLYQGDEWRGVISLSPNNADFIAALPDFAKITVYLGENGNRRFEDFLPGSSVLQFTRATSVEVRHPQDPRHGRRPQQTVSIYILQHEVARRFKTTYQSQHFSFLL